MKAQAEGLKVKNESLAEIQDPVARAKLEGHQEAVFSVDAELIELRQTILKQRGAVTATDTLAQKVAQFVGVIKKRDDDGQIDHDTAKVQGDVVKELAEFMVNAAAEGRSDLSDLIGQAKGLERASRVIGQRFMNEAQKFERYQRMEEEDAADELRAEAPEPPAVEAKGGNGKAPPKSKKTKQRKA
jgi:hypothetical protein